MLRLDTRNPIQVFCGGRTNFPKTVEVQTPYAHFTVGPRESATGKQETWFKLATRPAFEVAPLAWRDSTQLEIVLMKKKRLAGDAWRVKLPGGYYTDDLEQGPFRVQKVLGYTGLLLEEMVHCGQAIGHGEIETPIGLFYSLKWSRKQDPKEGILVEQILLEDAVNMAMTGAIENDASFSLIMRLYWMHQNGQI